MEERKGRWGGRRSHMPRETAQQQATNRRRGGWHGSTREAPKASSHAPTASAARPSNRPPRRAAEPGLRRAPEKMAASSPLARTSPEPGPGVTIGECAMSWRSCDGENIDGERPLGVSAHAASRPKEGRAACADGGAAEPASRGAFGGEGEGVRIRVEGRACGRVDVGRHAAGRRLRQGDRRARTRGSVRGARQRRWLVRPQARTARRAKRGTAARARTAARRAARRSRRGRLIRCKHGRRPQRRVPLACAGAAIGRRGACRRARRPTRLLRLRLHVRASEGEVGEHQIHLSQNNAPVPSLTQNSALTESSAPLPRACARARAGSCRASRPLRVRTGPGRRVAARACARANEHTAAPARPAGALPAQRRVRCGKCGCRAANHAARRARAGSKAVAGMLRAQRHVLRRVRLPQAGRAAVGGVHRIHLPGTAARAGSGRDRRTGAADGRWADGCRRMGRFRTSRTKVSRSKQRKETRGKSEGEAGARAHLPERIRSARWRPAFAERADVPFLGHPAARAAVRQPLPVQARARAFRRRLPAAATAATAAAAACSHGSATARARPW